MALTITSPVTEYNDCDSITGWTGADGVDTDEKIEGTGCLAADVDIETNIMLGPTITSIDMSTTKYAIYPWAANYTAAYLDTLAGHGLFVVLSDGSNSSYWDVGGSDTYPGGWEVLAANTGASPDWNSGTAADLTAITRMGFGFKGVQKSKLADNSFLDWVRYSSGTALKITGINTTAQDGWSEVLAGDTTLIAGIIKAQTGSYVVKGPIDIGDSTGTLGTSFSDTGSVVIFDSSPVGDNHHAITCIGNTTSATQINLVNQTFIGAGGRFDFDQSATNLNVFILRGGSLTHAGAVKFKASATFTVEGVVFTDILTTSFGNDITGCTFSACGLITMVTGATMDSCIIDSGTGAVALTAPSPADAADITNSEFISDGTGNGLEITGTAADFTLTNVDFTGYSTTVDANKAIYVNITTGTVNITISGGSGVTLSSHVRTAGATVNIISGAVTVKVTATLKAGTPVENARVYLKASDGTGPFPFEETVTSISRSGTTATVTHSAHGMASNDSIVLQGITDKTEDNYLVKQITVTGANSYTYTTTDSGSTSYTGTIKSTFVALSGLTLSTGILSTSRVYSSNQPVVGWTRKSTSTPFLQEGVLVGEIDSSLGFSGTAVMLADE